MLERADYLSNTAEDISTLQKALLVTMTQRKEILENYWEKMGIDPERKDAVTLAFPELLEQTTPVMVIIESMAEFISVLNPILTFSLKTLFEKAAQRNIYIVACFEPDIPSEAEKNMLFSVLQDQNVLFFGGQLDKQKLCNISSDAAASRGIAYNAAVMQYNKRFYPLVMPCGAIETQEKDEDFESIF